MSGQNWRTEVDASDYFGHQKKRVEIEQRRPVIRRAVDVVGPGIGASAVRVSDFNEVLATFNGYYSAEAGALNAPTDDEPYIGVTVSDAVLGGKQTVTGLLTNYEYSRTFVRNPSDPNSILWGSWFGDERVPATATASTTTETRVPISTVATPLLAPSLDTIGRPGSYSTGVESINVLRPGVYTGYVSILGVAGIQLPIVTVSWPDIAGTKTVSFGPINSATRGVQIPFTFWSTGESQEIRLSASHGESSPQGIEWSDISIARLGDYA